MSTPTGSNDPAPRREPPQQGHGYASPGDVPQGHQPPPGYGGAPGHQPPPGYGAPPGQQAPQGYGGQQYPPAALSGDDRVAAILAHLSAPIAFFVSAGTLSFAGPLIIWFMYKDRSPAVRHAAAGAFNFNLAFWVVNLAAWIAIFTIVGALVGIPLLIVSFIVAAIAHLRGTIAASNGEVYEYPFQIRVLS